MSPSDYKDLARKAKALGMVDYDLRRTLSRGQKSYLTKLSNQFNAVLNKPQEFFVRRVSKKTAHILKKNEVGRIVKDRVILRKDGATEMQVKRRGDAVTITKKSKTRTTRIHANKNPFSIIERLESMRLPEGWTIGMRFEGKDILVRFDDPSRLARYLTQFSPKQLAFIELVRFNEDDEAEE